MTIQNTYRKAVDRLPISGKKKNWLMRNKGAGFGVLFGLIASFYVLVFAQSSVLNFGFFEFFFSISLLPIRFVMDTFPFMWYNGMKYIFTPLLAMIFYGLIGLLIQSMIRKVIK